MAFDLADYRRGAGALVAPSKHLMAVDAIESSGENFWLLGNKHPRRFDPRRIGSRSGRAGSTMPRIPTSRRRRGSRSSRP
jgi:hypothetical protein